jgi:hypothetical protein
MSDNKIILRQLFKEIENVDYLFSLAYRPKAAKLMFHLGYIKGLLLGLRVTSESGKSLTADGIERQLKTTYGIEL